MKAVKVTNRKPGPCLDIGLENVVVAFLSGIKPPMSAASTALRDRVEGITPVAIGRYHTLSTDMLIDSDIVSACALQGIKAKDIVDCLLRMRMEGTDGALHSVVVVDMHKGIISPAVSTLDAVYNACRYVLKRKIVRNALANKPKPKAVK